MQRLALVFTFIGTFCMHSLHAQVPFYQDVFYGGVTGDGYSSVNLETTDTLKVYIESGSTIREAFLFVHTFEINGGTTIDRSMDFNGSTLQLSASDAIMTNYSDPLGPQVIKHQVLAINVTNLVNDSQMNYPITPPVNQDPTGIDGIFGGFYLQIMYDNTALGKVNVNSFINNLDSDQLRLYSFVDLNPIDLIQDVGFTFMGYAFCDTVVDGCYVSVDGSLIGLTGGVESTDELLCSGVRGAFYYQNSTLEGLDNDIANNQMSGPDALASIEPYLLNNTQFDVLFDYQNGSGGAPPSPKSNPIFELFTAYTTTCDTFSVTTTPDTIACQDTQLQLNATGGQTYEWLPTIGLSCADCPNPVFTADSTMNYTVRIWNNDSCSVVRPLHITVIDNTGIEELINTKKELIKIIDFMGRETEFKPNTPLIFIYSDGTRERVMEIEE